MMKVRANWTPEQQSEAIKAVAARKTAEERSAIARKIWQTRRARAAA